MKSRSQEINAWPAFSDMMFMLAVSCLAVSAGVLIENQRENAKAQEIVRRLRAMGIDPEHPDDCGLAKPVVKKIQDCFKSHGIEVVQKGCGLSVSGILTFVPRKPEITPSTIDKAPIVAECIIAGAQEILAAVDDTTTDPQSPSSKPVLPGLDTITIEGHADVCGYADVDAVKNSIALPAERAQTVYDMVFDSLKHNSSLGQSERLAILSRLATRSFGPFRPRRDSACDCTASTASDCTEDRRVEIVVQGRSGNAIPNWQVASRGPIGAAMAKQPLITETSE